MPLATPGLGGPTTFDTINAHCTVYSRAEVRRSTGMRGVSFVDCTSTEKIDTNGDGKPDDVAFRLVTVLNRKGAYVCHIFVAQNADVNITSGDCK